jgi:hypothetical protein
LRQVKRTLLSLVFHVRSIVPPAVYTAVQYVKSSRHA